MAAVEEQVATAGALPQPGSVEAGRTGRRQDPLCRPRVSGDGKLDQAHAAEGQEAEASDENPHVVGMTGGMPTTGEF